jgi:hypothetical protein
MKKKQKIFITTLVAFALIVFVPHAYATAGGFHGGGGGGHTTSNYGGGGTTTGDYNNSYNRNYDSYGNNNYHSYRFYHSYGHTRRNIYSPFDIIFIIIIVGSFLWKLKKPGFKKSRYVHGKNIGNGTLEAEIEQVFISIQEAWDKQDLHSVRALYTDELYAKHQKVIDNLLAKGLINHTKDVIVDGFSRYKQISSRSFEIDISFVAIDFNVNKDTNVVVQGNNLYRQEFKQRWTFIKDGNQLRAGKIRELKI